ncbi:hypothetical protein [Halalkaliarchaeum desulfuricum]|uniref:hypothetical protein n=1 Tax=Halalkaliarchaeum desulfuricum TaxID=2055893 RepID=UPI000E6C19D3|nr:hypothetical protein [Halalkaliarchaeum desulfuricum]
MDSECSIPSRTAGQPSVDSGTNFGFTAMNGTHKSERPGVCGSTFVTRFGGIRGTTDSPNTEAVASGSIASRVHRRVADSGDGRYRA